MVQGSNKLSSRPGAIKKVNGAKLKQKELKKVSKHRKGNPLKIPNNVFRGEALVDRDVSKAIAKKSESIVASKLFQGGGKITHIKDTAQKGKELNKEKKRDMLKKKLSRVEEKLNVLKDKAKEDAL